MSVLIKGMKMPKNCYLCHFVFRNKGDERVFCTAKDPMFDISETLAENRADDCPLIELPPHGRLIDADAAYDSIAEVEHAGNYVDMDAVGRGLDDAPTIIPAEPPKEK